MWWVLAASALAATVEVVATDGPLRPGVPATVLAAVVDDSGRPVQVAPQITVSAGRIRYREAIESAGVWSYVVVPPEDPGPLSLEVTALGRTWERQLEVVPIPASRLELPSWLVGFADSGEVCFRVTGQPLPPPEALQVVVGGGQVLSVDRAEEALEVCVDPGPVAAARYLPVAVRDMRHDEVPTWGGIRLRVRLPISYQTEPGTRLDIAVGRRRYGPFLADDQGIVQGWIDQYPGEMLAEATFTDDLGNYTRTPIPLSSSAQATLAAFPTGRQLRGRPAPVVYLHAVRGNGTSWTGKAPVCRTPAVGDLEVRQVAPGLWSLTPPLARDAQDIRIECALGRAAQTEFRVEVGGQVPERLGMRVWPEALSADFPVAEVQVVLEDSRGERLPVDGVGVQAASGVVVMDDPEEFLLRGEYHGDALVREGRADDVLTARCFLQPRSEVVSDLDVRHGPVPEDGTVAVHGRALDASGLPVQGAALSLSAGTEVVEATTGTSGWATAIVPVPAGDGPVVFQASTEHILARGLAARGAEANGGPAVPDLEAERTITLAPGRVAALAIRVPPLLVAAPNAATHIRVDLLDRNGNLVTDEVPLLTVDLGTVGPLSLDSDGSYVALYTAPDGERSRLVTFTAMVEGRTATAQLQLEALPVDRAPGLSVGVISNFGEILSPYVSADMAVRTRLMNHSIMFRAGLAWYRDTADVSTGAGADARVEVSLLPVTLALITRRDPGRLSQWLGVGGVLAPYWSEAWYGTDRVGRALGLLRPGFVLLAGAGYRIPGGEFVLESRFLSLSSGGGDVAYRGSMGGVAVVLGYRVPY